MSQKHAVRWYLIALLAVNLSLLLAEGHPLRVIGALLLIGLLPGLGWADLLRSLGRPINRAQTPRSSNIFPYDTLILASALSYTFTSLLVLLLSYRPGPVHAWQLLLGLDLCALTPLWRLRQGVSELDTDGGAGLAPPAPHRRAPGNSPLWRFRGAAAYFFKINHAGFQLAAILLLALILRAGNLAYSEFQGDEALAMLAAAEGLEGHDNALFLRSKGPAEVLLPMALWRLTGTITEATARLPSALASVAAVATIYLIGAKLGGKRLGGLAAGFLAVNGFMVAFGRIVQYQTLVVWFSALAFWLALQWHASRQVKLAFASGLCLGMGLLAHYDAILVLPAIGWLFITSKSSTPPARLRLLPTLALFTLGVGGVALPFYLPFSLDPQANRTGEYVSGRIGHELRNNLPDFFHFNSFYSSFYYITITGLLVLGLLAWLLWSSRRSRPLALLGLVAGAVAIWPGLLHLNGLDLSGLPFALLLLAAFFALPVGSPQQGLIAWLGVPFLGYNFVVALGLTHIYTIVPAWSLLAAWGWLVLVEHRRGDLPAAGGPTDSAGLQTKVSEDKDDSWPPFLSGRRWSNCLLLMGLALSLLFLWNAFLRTEVSYWQDYPTAKLDLFWTPFDQPPEAGLFGFVHRTGWKALGQLLAAGHLAGDFRSNEEPDVTGWYTRGAPRACDWRPEYYFLATDLVDPVDTPSDLLAETYEQVGRIVLPNQKQLRIMQQRPAFRQFGELEEEVLARAFDASAQPAAFARSGRGSAPVEARFGSASAGPLVRLIGYDLDTRRAYPAGRVPVTLYWQTLAYFPASYQVFAHLEGESGPVAQADGAPVCWTYPTDAWRPGQIIADQHAIGLSPEVAAGRYPLVVGLYLPETLERLDLLDIASRPAGTSLALAEVEIRGGAGRD